MASFSCPGPAVPCSIVVADCPVLISPTRSCRQWSDGGGSGLLSAPLPIAMTRYLLFLTNRRPRRRPAAITISHLHYGGIMARLRILFAFILALSLLPVSSLL